MKLNIYSGQFEVVYIYTQMSDFVPFPVFIWVSESLQLLRVVQ